MKILIVAATPNELEHIQLKLEKLNTEHDIILFATGVGMIATTFELTNIFRSEPIDLAINVGIAGAFNKTIELGEVVEVVQDEFSEELVEDGIEFRTYDEIGLRSNNEAPFSNGKLYNSFKFVQRSLDSSPLGLKEANAITVNTVHGNDFSIKRIKDRLNPDVETMEGAAFFYVCNKMEIPTIQLRAISNYVEKRNREKWEVELALRNLAEEVINVIDKLQ